MSSTLRAFLVNSSRALGVEPHHLNQPDANSDVQTALLQDVIALRDQGHADRSLALLDAAAEAGLSSDWIEDNRARALLALGRDQEALAVLETLTACGTEGVAKAAWQQMEVLTGPAVGDSVEAAPAAADVAGPEEAVDPTPVLKEAIQLRESGEAQASLDVLEQSLADGLKSPWIEDNRARALVMLERRAEALAIWERLAEGDDEGVQTMAAQMAESQRQTLLEELQASLLQVGEAQGRAMQHLLEAEPSLLTDLELPVLKQAIDLRESGDWDLSLQLLEAAIAGGLTSPWISDNRARVLVNLERYSEAVELWQQLLDCDIPDLEDSAKAMLDLNQDRGLEQKVLQNVDRALNESSSAEAGRADALEQLTDALLNDPGCKAFQERLGELAATQASKGDSAEGQPQLPELASHQKKLAGFDMFLSVLEKRCQLTPESSEAERV